MIRNLVIAALLALAFYWGAKTIASQKVVPKSRPKPVVVLEVETDVLHKQERPLVFDSHGTVTPYESSSLTFQVSGQVLEVAKEARVGQFVTAGQVLVQLETIDLENALYQAEATLATRQVEWMEEQARREQALQNWKRLGRDGKPPELLSREPQLKQKEALLKSARSGVALAQKNIERATLVAPFDGMITARMVDPSETVSVGQTVLELLNTEKVELRLPFTAQQLAFLDGVITEPLPVEITTRLGETQVWQGLLLRLDGEVETSSRQLYGIVEVDEPYPRDGRALRVGLFVQAKVTLPQRYDVVMIPRASVFNEDKAWLVNEASQLEKIQLKAMWEDEIHLWVPAKNWQPEWKLVTIPLGMVAEGTTVVEADREAVASKPRAKGNSKGNTTP